MDKILWVSESRIEWVDGVLMEITTLYDYETKEYIEEYHPIEVT